MRHLFALAALTLPVALAGQATAHATLAEHQIAQGETARLTIRIGHGCHGKATRRLRVTIPEGIIAAQPKVKAGWTLETVTGPYEGSYELFGETVSEGVREIIWSGNLPDGYYDEFVFRGRVTEAVPANETLHFPVVQECIGGAAQWTEIPAEGQSSHDLDSPAPGVMVVPADAGSHGH